MNSRPKLLRTRKSREIIDPRIRIIDIHVDMLVEIFLYLDQIDLIRLSGICKTLRSIALKVMKLIKKSTSLAFERLVMTEQYIQIHQMYINPASINQIIQCINMHRMVQFKYRYMNRLLVYKLYSIRNELLLVHKLFVEYLWICITGCIPDYLRIQDDFINVCCNTSSFYYFDIDIGRILCILFKNYDLYWMLPNKAMQFMNSDTILRSLCIHVFTVRRDEEFYKFFEKLRIAHSGNYLCPFITFYSSFRTIIQQCKNERLLHIFESTQPEYLRH